MAESNFTKRISALLTEEEYKVLYYWAGKRGMSIGEYVREALARSIRYENRDYTDAPSILVQQQNQIIDGQRAHHEDMVSLMRMLQSLADTVMGLTRGDNYLLEEPDDGDL